ncbi:MULTISPECIES: MarR family transcriptional regulator [unclassified Paenibacillus]|uniref:MarR family winged helix-turn-helix transcriptional regulator n=1 Tax=unclassified Paenibacillus TaxID=185978 RepID=UPI001AEAB91E|nr:DNA-binding MarR family transcriptional regulator [Paenibacillus sp. PvP091]MBP1169062.1 DNA-binding MarR family transcriptional regulator [Paenibacillus sp. PvR098]MBP2440090.1 DNA-binding MarR family transcriptional regulator [Paenibacillus sp. PvP052]
MSENSELNALTKQDERRGILLWFRLSRFYNQSIRETNHHLKKWNMTAAQFDVLAQVGAAGRITQQELAEKLVVTKGNITQLIHKVEELGWIEREQDWKTKYVSLTEAGKALFDDVVPLQERFQAAQFGKLNSSEQKQLVALLKKLQS